MDKSNESYEIDLLKLFRALLNRIWLIILAAVVGGGILLSIAAFLISPKYSAKATVYVNNNFSSRGDNISITNADLTASQNLVSTYIAILNSRTVIDEVIKITGLNYSYNRVKSMISSRSVNNTGMFDIVVTNEDPVEAAIIANAIVEVLPSKILAVVEGSSTRVVDYAVIPEGKSSPNLKLYTAVGILIGAVSVGFVIIIQELMNNTVNDEDYLTKTYNLPVLAVIPDISKDSGESYYSSYRADATKAEVKR